MAAENPSDHPGLPEEPELTILVGPQEVHLAAPQRLLRIHSAHFDWLFVHNAWLLSSEGWVRFENDEPEVFEFLLAWMRRGQLSPDLLSTTDFVDGNDLEALGDRCHRLCKLYELCERLDVSDIRMAIMKELQVLVQLKDSLPLQPRTVQMVIDELPKRSSLYDFVLQGVANDLLHENGHEYDYYDELLEGAEAIPGFLRALLRRMKRRKGPTQREGSIWREFPLRSTSINLTSR